MPFQRGKGIEVAQMNHLKSIAFVFLILFVSVHADLSFLDFKLDHVDTDLTHGCQYYTITNPNALIDVVSKPTSELSASKMKVSEIKNGAWEILIIQDKTRDVWKPDVICEKQDIPCDEKNMTAPDGSKCDEKTNTYPGEVCTDKGSSIKESYKEDVWIPMQASEQFKPGETKARYCASWQPQFIPGKGYGIEADMIPTFAGIKYDGSSPNAPAFAWWNATWPYLIPISINTTVATNLTNFPAMISLNTSNSTLWNTTSCTNVRFLDSTNTTTLNYELDSSSPTFCGNATNNATFWVSGNYTGGALTTIYAYLGNPGAASGANALAVWSSANYVGVWHMTSNSTLVDSVGNNNLTVSGSGVTLSIENGRSVNNFSTASTAYFKKTSPVNLPKGTGANVSTVTVFYNKYGNASTDWSLLGYGTFTNGQLRENYVKWDSYNHNIESYATTTTVGSFPPPTGYAMWSNRWGIYSTTSHNGWIENSTTITMKNGTHTLNTVLGFVSIGEIGDGTRYARSVTIYEARIMSVTPSDDWLKAEFGQTSSAGTVISNTATSITATLNSPINSTYTIYSIPVNATCDSSGSFTGEYLNITIDGAIYSTNNYVADGSTYQVSIVFPVGSHSVSASCYNGSYSGNSSSIIFSVQPTVTPTINQPTNTTYGIYNTIFNSSCSGSLSSYLLNISLDGNQSYITNQPIANSSSYQTTLTLLAGNHNTTSTCFNTTITTENQSFCYQETANASTGSDGSCGLNYNGSYGSGTDAGGTWDGAPHGWIATFDSDYSSYGDSNPGIGGAYVLINYSKPTNANSDSLWQIKDNNATMNLSIPSGCWNADVNKLFLYAYSSQTGTYWGCFNVSNNFTVLDNIQNGTNYITIRTIGSAQRHIFEEGMYWDVGNMVITGISATSSPILFSITPTATATINAPANTTYTTYSHAINISCSGSLASYDMNFSKDGIAYSPQPNVILNGSSFQETESFAPGYHNITAYCYNQTTISSTATRYFTVTPILTSTIDLTPHGNTSYTPSLSLGCAFNITDTANSSLNVDLRFNKGFNPFYSTTINNYTTGSIYTFNLSNGNLTSYPDYWECFISTNDSYSAISNSSNIIYVIGNAPEITNLAISPASPFSFENLSCDFSNINYNSPVVQANIYWYKNGILQPLLNQSIPNIPNATLEHSILNSNNLTVGNQWSCNVSLYDGYISNSSMSANVTVLATSITMIAPSDGVTLYGQPTFEYEVTSPNAQCNLSVDGTVIDSRTINTSSGIQSISDTLGFVSHTWNITCYPIGYASQFNSSTWSFSMTNINLNNSVVLSPTSNSVKSSPQALFYDENGHLNALYIDSHYPTNNMLIYTLNNYTVIANYSTPFNATKQFFVALREQNYTRILTFSGGNSYFFDINGSTITQISGTAISGVQNNSYSDPYEYADTKDLQTINYSNGGFFAFMIPTNTTTRLVQNNFSSTVLTILNTTVLNVSLDWGTIANDSDLTTWYFAFPIKYITTYYIELFSTDGTGSTYIAKPTTNLLTASQLNNSKVFFEAFNGTHYMMEANVTNNTIYNIETGQAVYLASIANPSHFIFIDNKTFVFFDTHGGDTYAYSCYFGQATATCTQASSSTYGVTVPYDRGFMVTATRQSANDVITQGTIYATNTSVNLAYNSNTYDMKYICYDEQSDGRKTFMLSSFSQNHSAILSSALWGYALPSASLGSTYTRLYSQCNNGTTRLFIVGLTGSYSLPFFSLNLTAGNYYTFTVKDQYSQPIQNVTITAQRFDNLFQSYVTIEQGLTDVTGTATLYLQPYILYQITINANGYVANTFQFIPSTSTSITIQLGTTNNIVYSLPNYETVFNDVSYSIQPSNKSYYSSNQNVSYHVSSANGTLQYYGWTVTKTYHGIKTTVASQNISGQPAGGILNITTNGTGMYQVKTWFKASNYSIYEPNTFTLSIGNASGLASAREELINSAPISGWSYYLIAVVVTMLVAGFVAIYTVDGAGLVALLVLWGFTLLYPDPVITCLAGADACITPLIATSVTTLMVVAGFFISHYFG